MSSGMVESGEAVRPSRGGRGVVKTAVRKTLAFFGQSPAWPLLALLIILFTLATPNFMTWFNVSNLLTQAVIIGMLAVGLTPVFISGAVDLSVGSVAGFAACLLVTVQPHVGTYPACVVALLAGLSIGLFNGLVVEIFGLNPIIVTLAMMLGIRSLTFLLFGSATISPTDYELLDLVGIKVWLFTFDVLVFLAVSLAVGLMLRSTAHGINTYAIGGNRRAAEDAGVNVTKHVVLNFALCGTLAALVGVTLVAQLGAAAPVFGQGYELLAIIAVVLGGTKLAGGTGTVVGTLVATGALTVLQNGVNLMNVDVRYVTIIVGVVLVLTLTLDRLLSGGPGSSE